MLDGSAGTTTGPAVQESFDNCAPSPTPATRGRRNHRPLRRPRGPGRLGVTNALDVDRVVFGGPFWSRPVGRYLELVPGVVRENSATRQIHPIDVVGTGVGEDVGAIGAASLVLEHTLAPALPAAFA